MPGITHWQHGKFFGYFPGIVTFESILGDMYSSSVTNPGFNVSIREKVGGRWKEGRGRGVVSEFLILGGQLSSGRIWRRDGGKSWATSSQMSASCLSSAIHLSKSWQPSLSPSCHCVPGPSPSRVDHYPWQPYPSLRRHELTPQWACSPACTELEQVVMDWMAGVLGLGKEFYGSSGKGGGAIGVSHRRPSLPISTPTCPNTYRTPRPR